MVSARAARPTGCNRSTARSRRCAAASASATSPRSARSTCRARTPARSSTRSTSTRSPHCRSAGRATALMLREDGFVLDDGTTSRLGPSALSSPPPPPTPRGCCSTWSSAHQVLWPELDVQFVSVTEQWAQYAVAGPRARDVLRRRWLQHDISDAAFPYMAAASTFGSRRACSASRSPASWPTRSACRRTRAMRWSAASLRPAACAVRHGGAGRHAHRERASGRQRDQRPDDGARPGARPNDVDPEGLHRPRDGTAPGAAGPGAAHAGRAAAGRPRGRGCGPGRICCRATHPPASSTTRAG